MCTTDLPPSHKQFEGGKKEKEKETKKYTPIHMHIEDQEITLE